MEEQKIDVFISHHTKSSLGITEAICQKLENNGVRVWYAPRNTVGSYAKCIVDAINRCRVFVLILNKESSFSEDVLNEINLAVERVRKGEKISILPFQVTNEDISDDAKYYIGRMHWIDAIQPPMQDRIEELSFRIMYLLENSAEGKRQESVKTVALKNTMIFPNLGFIGRKSEIEEIHSYLEQYKRVFLMGMGGIGKTEIAKQYIRNYQKEYTNVLFMKYETNLEDMIISEKELPIFNFSRREEDGVLETDEQYFFRKLEQLKELADEKTLLVVDNFDTEMDEYLEVFLEGPYQVLFTTRNDFEYLGYPVVKVEPFPSQEEQMQLFQFHYKKLLPEQEKEMVYQILTWIGGHTLTIELIAKLMSSKRIRPEQMISILKNEGIGTQLEGTVHHGFGKANTLYGYIDLLFNTSKLTEEEQQILRNLWLVPSSGVDLETFAHLMELQDCSLIDDLIKKSWIWHDYYLDKIALHPVIAEVIKERLQPSFSSCLSFVKQLTFCFSSKYHKSKEEIILLGEMAKTLYEKFPSVTYEWVDEYIAMVEMFKLSQHFEEGFMILNDILSLYQEQDLLKTKEGAMVYYHLGDLCLYQLHLSKACDYLEKSVSISEQVSPDSYDTGYLHKFLAFTYLKIGHYEEAQEHLKISRKILSVLLEEESSQMGSQSIAEARVAYFMKEYDKALELGKRAYHIFETVEGLDSYNILSCMLTLAQTYSKLGEYEKAITIGIEMIEKVEGKYSRNQSPVLIRYEALGEIYLESGDKEKAKETFQVILKELESIQEEDSDYYQDILKKIESI